MERGGFRVKPSKSGCRPALLHKRPCEIITQILEIKAPDADVFALLPSCETTDRGNPTRRSKIKYFLHRQDMTEDTFEEFVENDMENIVQLFRVFNDGTHGPAGTFDLPQLNAIRKRVEDGIMCSHGNYRLMLNKHTHRSR